MGPPPAQLRARMEGRTPSQLVPTSSGLPMLTSNMCFSFCEDLTEAEAAMMALSCCRGTERDKGSAGVQGPGTPSGCNPPCLPDSVPVSASGGFR